MSTEDKKTAGFLLSDEHQNWLQQHYPELLKIEDFEDFRVAVAFAINDDGFADDTMEHINAIGEMLENILDEMKRI